MGIICSHFTLHQRNSLILFQIRGPSGRWRPGNTRGLHLTLSSQELSTRQDPAVPPTLLSPTESLGPPIKGRQNASVPSSGQAWRQFHPQPQLSGLPEAPGCSVCQSVGAVKGEDPRQRIWPTATPLQFKSPKGAPLYPLPT